MTPPPQCTYQLGTLLGEGCSALVYRATVLASRNIPPLPDGGSLLPRGTQVAVKVFDATHWTADAFKSLRAEAGAMASLGHNRNIVRFYACSYGDGDGDDDGGRACSSSSSFSFSPTTTTPSSSTSGCFYPFHPRAAALAAAATAAAPASAAAAAAAAASAAAAVAMTRRPPPTGYYQQRAQRVAIVQELCSGRDLFDNVHRHGALAEDLAKHYGREVLSAAAHMHACRVAHRDLKLENAVLTSDFVLKICDFGLAVQWPAAPEEDVTEKRHGGDNDEAERPPPRFECLCVGTERYRAPEVQASHAQKQPPKSVSSTSTTSTSNTSSNSSATSAAATTSSSSSSSSSSTTTTATTTTTTRWYDPRRADAWSAAVMLFEMLLGHGPVAVADAARDWYFHKIAGGQWDRFWAQHHRVCTCEVQQATLAAPGMRAFFEAAFQPDPARRMTVAEMLRHPYLRVVAATTTRPPPTAGTTGDDNATGTESGTDGTTAVTDGLVAMTDEQVADAMRRRCRR